MFLKTNFYLRGAFRNYKINESKVNECFSSLSNSIFPNYSLSFSFYTGGPHSTVADANL